MRIELGDYILEVNVDATREYYKKAKYILEDCPCGGCQNYVKAIEQVDYNVKEFFNSIGVDILKSPEVYVNCSKNNALYYGGFYHICGTIIKGESPWKLEHVSKDGKSKGWTLNEDKLVCISNDFKVGFDNECALLSKDFPMPSIQLEIFAHLPWMLEVENSWEA